MQGVTFVRIDGIPAYGGEGAIPGIRFRAARDALGVSSWGMNVLEFDRQTTGYPEHDHAADGHEEVYVVLQGSLVVIADGRERTLRVGDAVRVAPTTRRKFVTRDESAVLLALGGTPGKPYTPSMGG